MTSREFTSKCNELGLNARGIRSRVSRGWNLEDSFNKPVRAKSPSIVKGDRSLKEYYNRLANAAKNKAVKNSLAKGFKRFYIDKLEKFEEAELYED